MASAETALASRSWPVYAQHEVTALTALLHTEQAGWVTADQAQGGVPLTPQEAQALVSSLIGQERSARTVLALAYQQDPIAVTSNPPAATV